MRGVVDHWGNEAVAEQGNVGVPVVAVGVMFGFLTQGDNSWVLLIGCLQGKVGPRRWGVRKSWGRPRSNQPPEALSRTPVPQEAEPVAIPVVG